MTKIYEILRKKIGRKISKRHLVRLCWTKVAIAHPDRNTRTSAHSLTALPTSVVAQIVAAQANKARSAALRAAAAMEESLLLERVAAVVV